MARGNPNGNPKGHAQNLKKGGNGRPGGWPGCGRPKLSVLKEKREWLTRITAKDFDVANAHPLELRLREIAETSNSSATIEYIYNQLYGAPKSTVVNEIDDTTVFAALGEVLPLHVDKETATAILNDLYAELGGSDSDSE